MKRREFFALGLFPLVPFNWVLAKPRVTLIADPGYISYDDPWIIENKTVKLNPEVPPADYTIGDLYEWLMKQAEAECSIPDGIEARDGLEPHRGYESYLYVSSYQR